MNDFLTPFTCFYLHIISATHHRSTMCPSYRQEVTQTKRDFLVDSLSESRTAIATEPCSTIKDTRGPLYVSTFPCLMQSYVYTTERGRSNFMPTVANKASIDDVTVQAMVSRKESLTLTRETGHTSHTTLGTTNDIITAAYCSTAGRFWKEKGYQYTSLIARNLTARDSRIMIKWHKVYFVLV